MDPARLSHELRTTRGDPDLARRRGIVCLALVASGAMAYIALYQTGVTRRLREPRWPRFDAERVDAAAEAYELLQAPDATIGLASYGTTALVAAMGAPGRARRAPWMPLVMAGKVIVDAVQAARLTRDQWVRHRAFCAWCLLAAGATFAMVPLALPEALRAARRLLAR